MFYPRYPGIFEDKHPRDSRYPRTASIIEKATIQPITQPNYITPLEKARWDHSWLPTQRTRVGVHQATFRKLARLRRAYGKRLGRWRDIPILTGTWSAWSQTSSSQATRSVLGVGCGKKYQCLEAHSLDIGLALWHLVYLHLYTDRSIAAICRSTQSTQDRRAFPRTSPPSTQRARVFSRKGTRSATYRRKHYPEYLGCPEYA